MGERYNPKGLFAEGILAKLEMNEQLAPLVRVFRIHAVPESIRGYKRWSNSLGEVMGATKDPDVDLVLRLGEWSQGAKLGFYFVSAKTLRANPEVLLDCGPNFSVFIDPPSPHRRGFNEVGARVSIIQQLNLSSASVRGMLQILADISSCYIELNAIRRDEWLSIGH